MDSGVEHGHRSGVALVVAPRRGTTTCEWITFISLECLLAQLQLLRLHRYLNLPPRRRLQRRHLRHLPPPPHGHTRGIRAALIQIFSIMLQAANGRRTATRKGWQMNGSVCRILTCIQEKADTAMRRALGRLQTPGISASPLLFRM